MPKFCNVVLGLKVSRAPGLPYWLRLLIVSKQFVLRITSLSSDTMFRVLPTAIVGKDELRPENGLHHCYPGLYAVFSFDCSSWLLVRKGGARCTMTPSRRPLKCPLISFSAGGTVDGRRGLQCVRYTPCIRSFYKYRHHVHESEHSGAQSENDL